MFLCGATKSAVSSGSEMKRENNRYAGRRGRRIYDNRGRGVYRIRVIVPRVIISSMPVVIAPASVIIPSVPVIVASPVIITSVPPVPIPRE